MAITPMNDPKLLDQTHAAMEIWYEELPELARLPVLPPHPDEHDVLDQLANRGHPVHQRRAMAPDLSDLVVEPAAYPITGRKSQPTLVGRQSFG